LRTLLPIPHPTQKKKNAPILQHTLSSTRFFSHRLHEKKTIFTKIFFSKSNGSGVEKKKNRAFITFFFRASLSRGYDSRTCRQKKPRAFTHLIIHSQGCGFFSDRNNFHVLFFVLFFIQHLFSIRISPTNPPHFLVENFSVNTLQQMDQLMHAISLASDTTEVVRSQSPKMKTESDSLNDILLKTIAFADDSRATAQRTADVREVRSKLHESIPYATCHVVVYAECKVTIENKPPHLYCRNLLLTHDEFRLFQMAVEAKSVSLTLTHENAPVKVKMEPHILGSPCRDPLLIAHLIPCFHLGRKQQMWVTWLLNEVKSRENEYTTHTPMSSFSSSSSSSSGMQCSPEPRVIAVATENFPKGRTRLRHSNAPSAKRPRHSATNELSYTAPSTHSACVAVRPAHHSTEPLSSSSSSSVSNMEATPAHVVQRTHHPIQPDTSQWWTPPHIHSTITHALVTGTTHKRCDVTSRTSL
jgi:hypothetical protein